MLIDLVYIPNPMRRERRRRAVKVDPGMTVADLLSRDLPAVLDPLVIIDGGAVPDPAARELTSRDRELIVTTVPESGAELGAAILFAVVSAAVGAGASFLISVVLGPPGETNQPDNGPNGSATYAWGGIRNTVTQGSPIPLIAGEHRVGGQVIQRYRRNANAADTDEYLYMVLALGHGQIEAIGDQTSDANFLHSRGGVFVEAFGNGEESFLDTQPRWDLLDGTANQIDLDFEVTDYLAKSVVSASDAAYVVTAKTGLSSVNIESRYRVEQYGSNTIALAINLTDLDNYHGLRFTSTTAAEVYTVVSGTETQLGTFTVAEGELVTLARRGATIIAEREGVEQGQYVADAALNSDNFGLVKTGVGGGSSYWIDAYVVRSYEGLPAGMHINGVDADTFRDVQAHVRLGTPGQETLPSAFSKVIQSYGVDLQLDTVWTEYRPHEDIEGFHLVLDFPRGLFDQSSGLTDATVDVEVEYSDDGGATFAAITGSPFTFTSQITSRFSRTIFHEPAPELDGTDQVIRVRRTTTAAAESNSFISDQVSLADVNEVLREDRQTYDDIAMLALRIKATDQLSGSIPTATCVVRGVARPTWDGVSGTADEPELSYEHTTNPAWVALGLLLDREEGLGNYLPLSRIDVQSFLDWAEYCDETLEYSDFLDEPLFTTDQTLAVAQSVRDIIVTDSDDAAEFAVGDYVRVGIDPVNQITEIIDLGDGNTLIRMVGFTTMAYAAGWTLSKIELEPLEEVTRHTFNGVFDGTAEAWEELRRVCRVGRAVPMLVGNSVRIRIERPADPVQLIADSNMVEGSLELSYIGSAERPDRVDVQFLNAAKDYDQDTAPSAPAGLALTPLDRREVINQIQLYGITNLREARREATFHRRAQHFLRQRIKFRVAADAIAAETGDIIRVASRLPFWSSWSGRANGTLQSFKIDSPMTMTVVNAPYEAIIRTADERAGEVAEVTSAVGDYAAGDTITTDHADSTAIVNAPASIGPSGNSTRDYRIVETRLMDDFTVEVEAVEYDPRVFDLIGWMFDIPVPCEAPGPGEDIPVGEFCYIPIADIIDCTVECGEVPDDGVCCCDSGVSITLTGDGAACATWQCSSDGKGIFIHVTPGCEGDELCLSIVWVRVCQVFHPCESCADAGVFPDPQVGCTPPGSEPNDPGTSPFLVCAAQPPTECSGSYEICWTIES